MYRNRITEFLDDRNISSRALARYKVSSSLEERLYATTDANHNVTSIDDVFGAVKERLVYGAYRNSTVLTAAWASTADLLAWSTRSQGEREDATTNTIDGRSRLYGIGMGRWMQADSEGYIDGANRYQFVGSTPNNLVDPTGLFHSWVHKNIINEVAPAFGMSGWYMDKLSSKDVNVDFSEYLNPAYHAQAPGWGAIVSDKMQTIKNTRRESHWYKTGEAEIEDAAIAVINAMGDALHILQDFFSHTDWIDGKNLNKVYNAYMDQDHPIENIPSSTNSDPTVTHLPQGWNVIWNNHTPHGSELLDLNAIENGTFSPVVTYFEGGTIPPPADDSHNRYAVDDDGFGRDKAGALGIPGSFKRARKSAVLETFQFT